MSRSATSISMPAWLHAGSQDGCELSLHIQPGAARSELAGLHGDTLKVRIQAPAVAGAANAALIAFLADRLELTRRDVTLLRGEKARRKTLRLRLPAEEVMRRIEEAGNG